MQGSFVVAKGGEAGSPKFRQVPYNKNTHTHSTAGDDAFAQIPSDLPSPIFPTAFPSEHLRSPFNARDVRFRSEEYSNDEVDGDDRNNHNHNNNKHSTLHSLRRMARQPTNHMHPRH